MLLQTIYFWIGSFVFLSVTRMRQHAAVDGWVARASGEISRLARSGQFHGKYSWQFTDCSWHLCWEIALSFRNRYFSLEIFLRHECVPNSWKFNTQSFSFTIDCRFLNHHQFIGATYWYIILQSIYIYSLYIFYIYSYLYIFSISFDWREHLNI